MSFYALGTKPLIDILAEFCINDLLRQAWYADNSSAIGRLIQVKKWWLKLNEMGPKFGYFPKPSKSVLIIKDGSLMQSRHLHLTCLPVYGMRLRTNELRRYLDISSTFILCTHSPCALLTYIDTHTHKPYNTSSLRFHCLYLCEPLRAKIVDCVGSYVRCHGEMSRFL